MRDRLGGARLLYSSQSWDRVIYRDGLARLAETAEALVDLGYAADMIFTERFGPTGSRNRAA